MVASCRADETCYDGPSGGEFTINLLRPLHSHPVYTNDITLRDQRHTPVITSQPVSSGSLMTDLHVAFTSSNQRTSQSIQGCCNECYDYNPCDCLNNCCDDCCLRITNCYTGCCEGIQKVYGALNVLVYKYRFWINCFGFSCCPCVAVPILGCCCLVKDNECLERWFCGCKSDNQADDLD